MPGKKKSQPKPKPKANAPTERTESRLLVNYAFDLARKLDISRLLVLADLLQDRKTVETGREKESIIWVVRGEGSAEGIPKKRGDFCIEIPDTKVESMDQVKLGLIMAVFNDAIGPEESVVCLAGAAGSKRLDNLLIANPRRDFPWFAQRKVEAASGLFSLRAFARLLEIALRFAAEGREGKPIGTIFVLGDPAELQAHVRPLILNPCEGHPRKSRQIEDSEFLETLRELASLDGAFIVDRRGVVESAGVYLDAPITKKVAVGEGLGARHTAAAALSAKTDAIAIVISESSGMVSVFSDGAATLQIHRSP